MHETQSCKVLVEPFSTGRHVTNGCEEICRLVHSGRLKSVNCDVNLPKGLDSDLHLIFLVTPATSIEPAVISDASLDNAQVFLTFPSKDWSRYISYYEKLQQRDRACCLDHGSSHFKPALTITQTDQFGTVLPLLSLGQFSQRAGSRKCCWHLTWFSPQAGGR